MKKNELYTQFNNIFFEKTRLSMITILYKEAGVSFNRFKKIIGGTDGAIYTHLKKLADAGYITQKKEIIGNSAQTVYHITETGKKYFKEYLSFLENIVIKGETL